MRRGDPDPDPDPGRLEVREVAAPATYELRRRVLRGGAPDADVAFPEDDRPGAFHLGAVAADGRVVGVATWSPEPTPRRPGAAAWRLRGMAVDPEVQGAGIGGLLLDAARDRLAQRGAAVAWADGRDTALAFYQRHGWVVEGDGYVTAIGIPHHTIVWDLARPAPQRPVDRTDRSDPIAAEDEASASPTAARGAAGTELETEGPSTLRIGDSHG